MSAVMIDRCQAEAQRKRFETARAHAMWFYGYALARTDDDRGRAAFLATRGPATFPFGDLAAVEAWLERLDAESETSSHRWTKLEARSA